MPTPSPLPPLPPPTVGAGRGPRWLWLPALVWVAACGNEAVEPPEKDVSAASADADVLAPDSDGAASDTPAGPLPCKSSKDCASVALVCDKAQGLCVDCNMAADCAGVDMQCIKHKCAAIATCKSDKDCAAADAICDKAAGVCVDCLGDVDCAGPERCKANQCVPPALKCVSSKDCADLMQVCGAAGECVDCESEADCAEAEFCQQGVCVADVCVAGKAECQDADNRLVCAPHGGGWVTSPCSGGQKCAGGVCLGGVCKAGEVACKDGKARTCKANGEGWDELICGADKVCVVAAGAATCQAKVCEPGAALCDGAVASVCNADGTAKIAGADCGKPGSDGKPQQCLGGKCVPASCTPGSSLCLDDHSTGVCKNSGTGYESAPCLGKSPTCWEGKCVKCLPGALYCAPTTDGQDSKILMKCDKSGGDGDIVTACEVGKVCLKAACIAKPVCSPGATQCNGAAVETCKADGSGWSSKACEDANPCTSSTCDPGSSACKSAPVADGTTCGAGLTCQSGKCAPGLMCKPNQVFCDGSVLKLCNEDGKGAQTGGDCADDGKKCEAGKCVAVTVCQAGQTQCQDGKAATCKADGTGWDLQGCDDANLCTVDGCDPKTGKCSAIAVADGQNCGGTKTCKAGKCMGCNAPCANGSCEDCNPAGQTLIPSSAFVDPNPPQGWVQCFGFKNTDADDVGTQALDACAPTQRLRMRFFDGMGTLTDDVWQEGNKLMTAWPDKGQYLVWKTDSGTLTTEKCGTVWPCGNLASFFGCKCNKGGGNCDYGAGGGPTLSNGNGWTPTLAPGRTDAYELAVPSCYKGKQWTGVLVAVYR